MRFLLWLTLMALGCTHRAMPEDVVQEPAHRPPPRILGDDSLPPRVAALRAVHRAYARLGDAAYASAALMQAEKVTLPKVKVEQLMEAARASYREARDAVDQTAYAKARELAAAAQKTADAVIFVAKADAPPAAAIAAPQPERGPAGAAGETLRAEEVLERTKQTLEQQAGPKTVAMSLRVTTVRQLERAAGAALKGMDQEKALNLAESARALAQASMHAERAEGTTLLMPAPPAGTGAGPAELPAH